MRAVTFKEVVDWIILNRRGNAFKDYPPNKIANEVIASSKQGLILCHLNDHEQIDGIVCAENNNGSIMVHDILTTEPGVFRWMLAVCKQKYPNTILLGLRNGKVKQFNRKALK